MTLQRFTQEQTSKANEDLLNKLFRGRPYTKAIPFLETFTGVAGETFVLWTPVNAYFETAMIYVRSSAADIELAYADSTQDNPFGFQIAPTTRYDQYDFGLAPYRSLSPTNTRMLITDINGVATVVRGVIYGWEVTPEGWYR
jgi:hypothetical protein